ncbi:type II toxin-antitoxin system HicA family toxin [Aphanizomenon sp. UHCC 0183]
MPLNFSVHLLNISISIPIHGNEDLKIGLLKSLMKQADLTESDLI